MSQALLRLLLLLGAHAFLPPKSQTNLPHCDGGQRISDDVIVVAPKVPTRPRIAVLTIYHGQLPPSHDSAVHSQRCYAELHGYWFIFIKGAKCHFRKPHWSRVLFLGDLLPSFDWIFYLDADVMVVNASIRAEDFIFSAWTKPSVDLNCLSMKLVVIWFVSSQSNFLHFASPENFGQFLAIKKADIFE